MPMLFTSVCKSRVMNAIDENLDINVIKWLRAELSIPQRKKIDGKTKINLDLGVDGDDGLDLVIEFGKKFDVDVSNFPFSDYFGPEAGINPFTILVTILRTLLCRPQSGLKPLYVEEFIRMAQDAKAKGDSRNNH
jgi:acyl carrier protein